MSEHKLTGSARLPDGKATSAPIAGRGIVLGRRRHFLVDRRSQLRAAVLATCLTAVLLLLLNVSLQVMRAHSRGGILADSPELAAILEAQDRAESLMALAASVVILGGVFLIAILETHKTAGAAFNIAARMGEIRDGRYGSRVKLRKNDNLRELEDGFNEMSEALRDLAWRDIESLEEVAAEAESVPGAEPVAARLRGLAERIRGRVSGSPASGAGPPSARA